MNRLVLSVVALVALSACCQGHPDIDFPFGRIVNGEDAEIESFPYQVSIQTTKGSHFCGGSLIDSETILTAAHCMQSYAANELQVRLGSKSRSSGGEVVGVRAFKFHEGYNSKLMVNDVAIMKLSTPVRQTSKIRAIELESSQPVSGTSGVVTGWGTKCFLVCSSPDTLLQVTVDLLHYKDCASSTYKYGSESILETMVCATGEKKDACQGDSGGPLVANGKQVGVVSWGNGCAWSGYPGVYADVPSLKQWIEATSATLVCNKPIGSEEIAVEVEQVKVRRFKLAKSEKQTACCQGHPDIDFPFGRIVNGEDAEIESFPYQVSIQTTKGFHFCGGSLIDSETILTAAHCMQTYAANELQVRLGSKSRSSGGEVVGVRAFKFHEGYNSKLMVNDVAIMKLSTPVRQTSKIRAIELESSQPVSGTSAVVTGWGTKCFLFCSSPDTLLQVAVDLLHYKDCASSTYKYGSESILETMVCAKGEKKDACQGDSGGPLVANGKQVGVVSWGQGCAWSNYPGVYADVPSLKQWIEATSATL